MEFFYQMYRSNVKRILIGIYIVSLLRRIRLTEGTLGFFGCYGVWSIRAESFSQLKKMDWIFICQSISINIDFLFGSTLAEFISQTNLLFLNIIV